MLSDYPVEGAVVVNSFTQVIVIWQQCDGPSGMEAKWSAGQGKNQLLQCGCAPFTHSRFEQQQTHVTSATFCPAGAWNRSNNIGQPVAVTSNTEQPLCHAALHKAHLTLSQTKGR